MFCLRNTVTEQSLFLCSKEKKSGYRKINKSLQTFNTILLDSDLDCDIELKSYNEIYPLRTVLGGSISMSVFLAECLTAIFISKLNMLMSLKEWLTFKMRTFLLFSY